MKYLKLAPYALIALLLIGLMYFRGEMLKSDGIADTARAEADSLRAINAQNADTIERQVAAAEANASIMADLQADVAAIRGRRETTRTIIEKAAANDPVVKSWVETPVPDSVRDALRRPTSLPDAKASH